MNDDDPIPRPTRREQLVRQILDVVDERHEGRGHRGFNHLLDSMRRICRRADGMFARDERWRAETPASFGSAVRSASDTVGDSVEELGRARRAELPLDLRAPLPVLAVAEKLIAKTLVTFAGRETVTDLSRWTGRATSTISRPERIGERNADE